MRTREGGRGAARKLKRKQSSDSLGMGEDVGTAGETRETQCGGKGGEK
jgi:hypothetical protein